MNRTIKWIFAFFSFVFMSTSIHAQQQVKVTVYPTLSKTIRGEKELQRKKFFNVAGNVVELKKHLKAPLFNYYLNDLGMSVGRTYSMVGEEKKWYNTIFQDENRPGWADTLLLANAPKNNIEGYEELKSIYGENSDGVMLENQNAFPDFMSFYQIPNAGKDVYPANNSAAAELVAHVLKHRYNDFNRPKYYHIAYNTHWKYRNDTRISELHLETKRKINTMNLDVKVGGPSYSSFNFKSLNYGGLSHMATFIGTTNFELDFYSSQNFDYLSWNDTEQDFTGYVLSGLPINNMIESLAAITYNEYGKELKYISAEFGAYQGNYESSEGLREAVANKFFPGSGFLHELEKRSILNFNSVNSAIAYTMAFMDHPHVIEKTVPFFLFETSAWNPTNIATLLLKENYDSKSTVYHSSRLIDYFRFFADVKGRRVLSECNDPDIQHHAFVHDDTIVLLFHNQSNLGGTIQLDLDKFQDKLSTVKIRRLNRKVDYRPNFEEENTNTINSLTIAGQESVAVFITTENTIVEKKDLAEVPYYSLEVTTTFTGTHDFTVEVPNPSSIEYASLRIPIHRNATFGKEITISVNGIPQEVKMEDCAERITNELSYITMKKIAIDPKILTTSNTITVAFSDGEEGSVGAVTIRALRSKSSATTIQSPTTTTQLKVFPNPTRLQVTVSTRSSKPIFLLSSDGKLITTKIPESGLVIFNTSNLRSGTYIFRQKQQHKITTQTLIIK